MVSIRRRILNSRIAGRLNTLSKMRIEKRHAIGISDPDFNLPRWDRKYDRRFDHLQGLLTRAVRLWIKEIGKDNWNKRFTIPGDWYTGYLVTKAEHEFGAEPFYIDLT